MFLTWEIHTNISHVCTCQLQTTVLSTFMTVFVFTVRVQFHRVAGRRDACQQAGSCHCLSVLSDSMLGRLVVLLEVHNNHYTFYVSKRTS